ncbi:MAG: zinc-ribbon domain-containing protein [Lachnospiraceae bacterium]|nr:zinc-ribbon domain-containing protein [Lachnospiraceae bacterium]
MTGWIIAGTLAVCGVGGAWGLVMYLRGKIRRASRDLFGTDSFVEGYKQQSMELSTTPKSVSGMTRLLEPQIQRDFPEFNWMQFRDMAEEKLRQAFMAITAENLDLLKDTSQNMREEVANIIQANRNEDVKEVYEDVDIHQTEIANYEKKAGRCLIILQSAVGYLHYKEKDGRLIAGKKDMKTQTKYNVELLYIQDPSKVNANAGGAVGLTCPHCGAPVTNLGAKFCEYCGSAVKEINLQVWCLHRFYEVTYQKV